MLARLRAGPAPRLAAGKRRERARSPSGMSASFRRRLLPYVLVSPLVVFIGALSFVPTADTTVEAFFRVMPLDPPTKFIGLGNFRALFANPVILTSWVNTAAYVAIGV